MSTVTLNLRTSNVSKIGNKSSKQKCAECLPNLPPDLDHLRQDPLTFDILNAISLDAQIVAIRKAAKLQSDLRQYYVRLLVHWYFTVSSGSCLKTVLASALNKDDENGTVEETFHIFLLRFLQDRKSMSQDQSKGTIAPDMFASILRCFENCESARKAIKRIKSELLKLYESEYLTSLESSGLSSAVRSLLLLQGLDKSEPTFLLTQSLDLFRLPDLTSDSKSQLAIFIINEVKATKNEGWICQMLDSMSGNLEGPLGSLDSYCTLHLAIALMVTLSDQELILNREVINRLYDVIERVASSDHESGIILSHSMAVLQCAMRLCNFICGQNNEGKKTGASTNDVTGLLELCGKIEAYSWAYLLSFVPKIRYNARNTLTQIVKIYRSSSHQKLTELINRAVKLSWKQKTKYVVLSSVAKEGNYDLILSACTDIVESLMDNVDDPTIENLCSELYEILMTSSFTSESEDLWLDKWIRPLMNGGKRKLSERNNIPLPVLERWVRTSVRVSPKVSETILDQNLKSTFDNDNQNIIQMALIVIKMEKTSPAKPSEKSAGLSSKILGKALRHNNEKIRLQAFGVIVTSRSSKEVFSREELELLEQSIPNCMVLMGPADRQDFVNLVKKMFLRISERFLPSKANDDNGRIVDDLKRRYETFLVNVGSHFFASFFDGANFSRRCIALECLDKLFKIFGRAAVTSSNVSSEPMTSLASTGNAEILIRCLDDSYEKNKIVAISVLGNFPVSATRMDDPADVRLLWARITYLCRSHKPQDSLTVGYLAKFICTAPALQNVLECDSLTGHEGKVCSKAFVRLKDLLVEQMMTAQSNLLEAADTAAMYPVLVCIRSILNEAFSVGWCDGCDLRSELRAIISSCYVIADVIKVVINSDSPEGHLPMDFFAQCPERNVTSQMLLLCAWRTSKEISLFLGDVCTYQISNERFNLNDEEVSEMASFFTNLLAEIKHRGAFEQAYLGFCNLCNFLWRRKTGESCQPPDMLKETMAALTGTGKNKFCSTRRSAGVPFLIQAIVSTQPEPEFPALLLSTMKDLVTLCKTGSAEVRVHACNILRVLYRDSRLGEAVEPFVADGVRVAIEGFKAAAWSERNSATLLFSALMTRIFGVKRSKDDLSKKNSLTARVFFVRYPELHGYLLGQLRSASEIIVASRGSISPAESAIFPVLLMLAKLQPSPFSEDSEPVQVIDFLPFLNICSGSSVLKVRQLSSHCLIAFLSTPDVLLDWLIRVCNLLESENRLQSHNQLHGYLLQVQKIVRLTSYESDNLQLFSIMSSRLGPILEQLVIDNDHLCLATRAITLEILFDLNRKSIFNTFSGSLKAWLSKQLSVTEKKAIWICHHPLYLRAATTLMCQILGSTDDEDLSNGFHNLVIHPYNEVIAETLKYISENTGKVDSTLIAKVIGRMSNERNVDSLKLMIDANVKWFNIDKNVFIENASKLMKTLLHTITTFELNAPLVASAIRLTGLLVESTSAKESDNFLLEWSQSIHEASKSEDVFPEVSEAVSEAIIRNNGFLKPSSSENAFVSVLLWDIILNFAINDDESVRKMAFDIFVQFSDKFESFPSEELPGRICSAALETCGSVEIVAVLMKTIRQCEDFQVSDSQGRESGVEIEPAFDKNEMNVWREGLVVKRQIILSLNQWTRQLIREDNISDVKKSCDPNLAEILFCEEFDQKQFELDVETMIKLVSEELYKT